MAENNNEFRSKSTNTYKQKNRSLRPIAQSNKNMPPMENLPKNILDTLNDDCIQAILLRLSRVSHFLKAAEECIYNFSEKFNFKFSPK